MVPTFASHIAGRSSAVIPIRYEPAAWMTASAPSRCSRRRAGVREVVGDELRAEAVQRSGLGRVPDERHDLLASIAEPRDHAAADEPGAAGDDDPHQEGPGRWGSANAWMG